MTSLFDFFPRSSYRNRRWNWYGVSELPYGFFPHLVYCAADRVTKYLAGTLAFPHYWRRGHCSDLCVTIYKMRVEVVGSFRGRKSYIFISVSRWLHQLENTGSCQYSGNRPQSHNDVINVISTNMLTFHGLWPCCIIASSSFIVLPFRNNSITLGLDWWCINI